MARFPTIQGDFNAWGKELNDLLAVVHEPDGNIRGILSVATDIVTFSAQLTCNAQANFRAFVDFARTAGIVWQARRIADAGHRFSVNSLGVNNFGDGTGTTILAMAATAGILGGHVLDVDKPSGDETPSGIDVRQNGAGNEAFSINSDGGELKFMSETFTGELMRLMGGTVNEGRLVVKVPNVAIPDVDLNNGQASLYLDAGENNLLIKVKTSAGTVKTGTVAVLT